MRRRERLSSLLPTTIAYWPSSCLLSVGLFYTSSRAASAFLGSQETNAGTAVVQKWIDRSSRLSSTVV